MQNTNELLFKVQAELSRYTYKHNVQINASEGRHNTLELRLTGWVIDVRTGCENIIHTVQTIYPEDLSHCNFNERFQCMVERLIKNFEDHEFKEWFKYDGACVYNPHPELIYV